MNSKLKKLTWKIFIERKSMEILKVLTVILFLFLVNIPIGMFGNWFICNYYDSMPPVTYHCNKMVFMTYFSGWFFLIIGFLVGGFLLYCLYKLISSWLSSNWEKAEHQAKKELRKK